MSTDDQKNRKTKVIHINNNSKTFKASELYVGNVIVAVDERELTTDKETLDLREYWWKS